MVELGGSMGMKLAEVSMVKASEEIVNGNGI